MYVNEKVLKEGLFMSLAYDVGFNIIGPLLVGAAGYAIGRVRALKDGKRNTHPPLADTTRRDVQVHELLAELRILLGASRTYVSRYHNGEKYLDNNEFLKKSRTHEVVAPGVSYQGYEYHNILVSSMAEESKLVVSDSNYCRIAELPDSRFKRLCEAAGVVATVREAIMRNSDIVGFIGADFDDDIEPARLDLLPSYARRIQSALQSD